MNRSDVQTAGNEGIKYSIKSAGGEKYEVTDRNTTALGKNRGVVIDAHDLARVLSLLAIPGIPQLKSAK